MIASPSTPSPFDPEPIRRCLQELIGKDPAATYFRTIRPGAGANGRRKGADLLGFDPAALLADNRAGQNVYMVVGRATAASGVDKHGKPTGAVTDDDVADCPCLFLEWDDKPKAEQLRAWEELGLPEPTAMIDSGGKSVHVYWRMAEPITPAQWTEATARLIAHCGSDRTCSNLSRLMRVPGFAYINKKTGKPTGGKAEVIHTSGRRYSLREVMDCLPDPVQQEPAPSAPQRLRLRPVPDLPPRSLEEVNAAAEFIPMRVVGGDTYKECRNALCGCSAALAEAGCPDPDAAALEILGGKWPSREDAERCLATTTTRASKSFWAIAGKHGYDQRRHDLRRHDDDLTGFNDEGQGQTQPPSTSRVISLDEVRERLANAFADGASQSDMEVLRIELASASDLNPAALAGLLRTVEQEQETRMAVTSEARTLRAEQDRQEIGQAITLAYLFPPSLAEALQTRCRYLPADAASTALSFLAAVAGLVKLGSEVIGIKAADFRVPLNLYTALVGKSGAKKSPLRKLVVDQPAEPLRLDLARAHTRAVEQWRQDNQGVSKSDRTEPPEPVYISVSNTTVEALAQQLQRQEGKGLGLLINRDEISGLFGSLGAYKGGRGDDEQHLLESYDGGGFRCLRISSPEGGRSYDRCSLSIYGTIQPGVLTQLVANGDDSGLWARFMFVPLPEKVVDLPEVETDLEVQEATAAAAALADACGAVYRMPRTSLELSPEARRAFVRYESRCQVEALRASIGAQSALWGKAAGKVLRIAGLLHLLQLAAPDGQASGLISTDTMERATALVDHINGWTLSLHADLARSGANDLMRLVHRIAIAAQEPIRWKQVQNRLSVKQKKEIDSAAVAIAMAALADLGVGEIEHGAKGGAIYRATAALP